MSGYPPNYGYGPSPPTAQPYGQTPPVAQPYGQTPPVAQPYGVPSAPYAPSSENPHKPSKDKPSSQNYPSSGGYQGYQNPSSGGYQGYQNPSSGGYQGYQNPSSGYSHQSSGYQNPSSGYPNHQSPGHPSSGYPNSSSGYPSSGYPNPPPQYPPSGPGGYGSKPFGALVPSTFPPGIDPSVIACFQVADVDGSGQIDDVELQRALSSYNQSFSIRTVHLLMYLFTNSNIKKIGPREFVDVFYSLQNWRAIFDRFDRDRSGKIDPSELRDALLSLGFAVSPVVLDLLVSKFDKSGGRNKAIEYDNFIECCLTVKGLTEKFKEKDTAFTGSATFNYETFMLTVLPFLIA